jgi:PTS system nitrogen regulatory IIA component
MVIPDLKAQDRDGVIKEMVHFLKKSGKIAKEKNLYLKLIEREEKVSTAAIGGGVAFPHCKIKGVNEPILALAVSKKGVDFGSFDELPTHVFFLVVSSQEKPSMNIQILAEIAGLVRKSEFLVDNILNVDGPEKIIEVIWEEEKDTND